MNKELQINKEDVIKNIRYLNLLAEQYPTINAASTEIINLKAILNLPKGTEHFITDVHGENEALMHILKNASGVIKRKLDDIFGETLRESDKRSLATLIYYPEQKLDIILEQEENVDDWYRITLYRLVELCRRVSLKYTRSKVRKALPKEFSYIIEELLHEHQNKEDKDAYYKEIIKTIIDIDKARDFIIALSNLIQRLVIDRLHIIGDIFDRGPGADIILDTLEKYHSVDIQWGNHDILWMGAASGSRACVANVLRISAKYANLGTLEDGYGINLLPLATFAIEYYKDDPCERFIPTFECSREYSNKEAVLISKMHKAISIIQFKLEGEIIERRKEFKMEDRLILNNINFSNGKLELEGEEYELIDSFFPTIDKDNPYRLTLEEEELINKLTHSFINSEKLNRHIRFLFAKGSMYLKFNCNLLYHGCIPLDEEGDFKSVEIDGGVYKGKDLLDKFDTLAREGYFNKDDNERKCYGMDIMWYLWIGENSPLFGKNKMATFERYFLKDKKTHKEEKNYYYKYRDEEFLCDNIADEFSLKGDNYHIINGHVPVEGIKGESPIKANGKLLVIDGGFSKSYQEKTGIAGYTLIYNSFGLLLVSHEPFESTEKAIKEETDILSSRVILETAKLRQRVRDTDIGVELNEQISDLNMLLYAYKNGLIKEKSK